ncbi:hypothetical protein D9M72_645070 [compost metagenome]
MLERLKACIERTQLLGPMRETLQHLFADIAAKIIGLPVVSAKRHVVPLKHAIVIRYA